MSDSTHDELRQLRAEVARWYERAVWSVRMLNADGFDYATRIINVRDRLMLGLRDEEKRRGALRSVGPCATPDDCGRGAPCMFAAGCSDDPRRAVR